MNISACIISYNEEEKIEECLRSLKPVVDEIVVVDSMSTDATVEIAKRHGARVIQQQFLGYAAQRNVALDEARHDWILTIDCDERLSPELQAELLAEKPHLGREVAYDMPRRSFYIDRWIDHAWYPDRGVRLFDRRVARYGKQQVHEQLHLERGTPAHLKGDLLHLTCDSVSQHLGTIDRYSEIAARSMHAEGRRTTRIGPTLRGAAVFAKLYILKRGILDGYAGFVVSVLSGVEAFVRYTKLWYLQRQSAKPPG